MKHKPLLLVVLAFVCCITTQTWAGVWVRKAPIPTPMSFHIAQTVDGQIYAGQGVTRQGGSTNGIFYKYDPITNQWTYLDNHSDTYQRAHAVIDGKIYAFGGIEHAGPLSKTEVYDPGSRTWSTLTPMPSPRTGAAAAVVDGKAYVIGGSRGTVANEAYNPTADSWKICAPMPGTRWFSSAAAVGGKIYVFGGMAGPGGAILDSVDVYEPSKDPSLDPSLDPSTNPWTTLTTQMPHPRTSAAIAVIDEKILLFGGWNRTEGILTAVDEFDPLTGLWVEREPIMPSLRANLAAAVVDGVVYVIAGEGPPDGYTGVVEVYDPDPLRSKYITGTELPLFDVFVGDIFTYTIEIENPFAQGVYVIVRDTLDAALDYVLGSFTVDGSPASDDAFDNDELLYPDHWLEVGASLSLAFQVEVQDVPVGTLIDNTAWITAYTNGTTLAEFGMIAPQAHVVPEPSTLFLFGIGLVGISGLVWRKLRKYGHYRMEREV